MTKDRLTEAAEKFPTPMYLYDTDEFQARIERVKHLLNPSGERENRPIGLTFSMKANPFLVETAVPLVERIEVCSFGEFEICRDRRIPPEKLLISGVLKKKPEVMEMASYGGEQAIYTAESPLQLAYLDEAGKGLGLRLPVLLRLTSGNQFGMDEDTILSLVKGREEKKHVKIIGLHFFSGTRKKNLKKTGRELEKLDDFLETLREKAGFEAEMMEYGTGFSVPVFEGDAETVTPEFMKEFRGLTAAMRYGKKITVEMGRALAYDCGYYLTRVLDVKETRGTRVCIVDGGMHQLNYDGQMRGMYRPVTELIRRNSDKGEAADAQDCKSCMICGSLCTVNDVLIADYGRTGPLPESGDLLVFRNAGAYSINEGMSTFLSHELPEVVLSSSEFRRIRPMLPSWKLNTVWNSVVEAAKQCNHAKP